MPFQLCNSHLHNKLNTSHFESGQFKCLHQISGGTCEQELYSHVPRQQNNYHEHVIIEWVHTLRLNDTRSGDSLIVQHIIWNAQIQKRAKASDLVVMKTLGTFPAIEKHDSDTTEPNQWKLNLFVKEAGTSCLNYYINYFTQWLLTAFDI